MKYVRMFVAGMMLLLVVGVGRVAAQGATANVSMTDFKYDPATLTVAAGTTVTWKNNGAAPHTVTASDGNWDSGNLDPGATFSKTFETAASIPYYCKYHGAATGTGMVGKVEVTAAQAQPTAAPAPTADPAPGGLAPSISAVDQQIKDGSIVVAKVVAVQDGWVAVHKTGPDGKLLLTPLAGLVPIKAGTATDVMVKLDENYAAGAVLYPMLHIDAGQIGTYEFPGGPDTPVQVDGKVVVVPFKVTGAPAAPAPSVPPSLPNTGSSSSPLLWVLAAAVLLVGVGTLVLRRRRAA